MLLWRDLVRSRVDFLWNVPPVRAVFSAWGGRTDRQTDRIRSTAPPGWAVNGVRRSRTRQTTAAQVWFTMYTRALRPSGRPLILPYLEGEGELLCRPYCLSHSSRSFSRLSRSLRKVESPAVRRLQHANTIESRWAQRAGRSLCLTSCVFCVPWLAALPPSPGNETHRPGVSGKKKRRTAVFLYCVVFFRNGW